MRKSGFCWHSHIGATCCSGLTQPFPSTHWCRISGAPPVCLGPWPISAHSCHAECFSWSVGVGWTSVQRVHVLEVCSGHPSFSMKLLKSSCWHALMNLYRQWNSSRSTQRCVELHTMQAGSRMGICNVHDGFAELILLGIGIHRHTCTHTHN